ncbi:MAG: hypothetical protein R6X34_15050 [Chloroflexota bacterium]
MKRKAAARQMIALTMRTLPYWWDAWRSGGTSRGAVWLQAGWMVWVLMRGGQPENLK